MDGVSDWIAHVRRLRLVAAAAAGVAVSLIVLGAAQTPPDRVALLNSQRAAVTAIERKAFADAARAMAALAADTSPLPPALRTELTDAARPLATATDGAAIDTAPILALLERVRKALTGEVALGLTFQGGFSQSKPKDEPVYGGHASAMGPAPPDLPAAGSGATSSPVTFEEGVRLTAKTYDGGPTKDHILESNGSGVALLDYDGDGRLDIYLVTAASLTPARERVPHRNVLYRNLGGWQFEDVSRQAGVDGESWGNGVCAGDADGDGRLDLYVTNWGSNFLYRNRGDGTFEEIAARAGVAAGGWSTGCTFFDADNDGDLDLYVARYVETTWESLVHATRSLIWRNGPKIMVGPQGLPGEADLYFENQGGGRFVEASEISGLADRGKAYGFGVVATDYDDDGLVDLFVANDSNPNFLYHNLGPKDGHARFESVGLVAGVAVNGEARAQAGMGVDAGDYDGDGRMDLTLTAFAHDRNALYRNVTGREFEEATATAGLAGATFERMGWGTAFLDADLDGRLDLFVANGHIFADVDAFPALGETFRQKNQIFLNQGTRFRDVSAAAGGGLQIARVGRGLAIGDLDDDGDPDVVVSNMDDVPTVLQNRQHTRHHWIALRVTAPAGNRFAIGARVAITAGGRTQIREIRSGGSYLSQSDLRVLAGLGDAAGPVAVEVRMPGGARWRFDDLAADRLHALSLEGPGRR